MKKALITGISGQDGSYLAELLLEEGYDVYGIIRRNSLPQNQTRRIEHIQHRIKLFYGDLLDISSLISIIKEVHPEVIFNLAAQSHVQVSFENPLYTIQVNCDGFINLLESVRIVDKKIKIVHASSSEMFGNTVDEDGYQRETTSMNPVSPYGCSKLFAYKLTQNYRHSYDMFISNSICFNHESERRALNFVTAKICKGFADIKKGKQKLLPLGDLNPCRDWGHAKDYVKAMYLISKQEKPDDFIISTGITHSVLELVALAFKYSGLNGGYEDYIAPQTQRYMRPEELNYLRGDYSKIKNQLGWKPTIVFNDMIKSMVEYFLNNE